MKQRGLFLFVALLVIGGTIFAVAVKAPEERTIKSDDARATLQGEFLASDNVTMSTANAVYTLYPVEKVLTEPAVLTVQYPETVQPQDTYLLRLAYFDAPFGMWRSVDTSLDVIHHTVSATMSRFGKWRVVTLSPAKPNFDEQIQSLIDAPPPSAVGFTVEVGFTDASGDFVIVPGAGKSGGCSGQYRTGDATTLTSRGELFSDQLQYQIVALWQIGEGCPNNQVIE